MKYQVIGTYYGQSELLFETDYLPDAEAVKIVISEENKYSSYRVGILVNSGSAKFVNMPQFLRDNGKTLSKLIWNPHTQDQHIGVTYPYALNGVVHYVTILKDMPDDGYTVQDNTTGLVLANNLSKDDVKKVITKGFELGYRNGFTLLGGLLDD